MYHTLNQCAVGVGTERFLTSYQVPGLGSYEDDRSSSTHNPQLPGPKLAHLSLKLVYCRQLFCILCIIYDGLRSSFSLRYFPNL